MAPFPWNYICCERVLLHVIAIRNINLKLANSGKCKRRVILRHVMTFLTHVSPFSAFLIATGNRLSVCWLRRPIKYFSADPIVPHCETEANRIHTSFASPITPLILGLEWPLQYFHL